MNVPSQWYVWLMFILLMNFNFGWTSCRYYAVAYNNLPGQPSRLQRLESVAWQIVASKVYDTTVNNNNNNNNGPNGHLFYVGGDLMVRRGMLPIIMLPDGDLRIVLHLMPFWILTIWGISRTLVNNRIIDQSDVVGASPVGAAPTTSSLST